MKNKIRFIQVRGDNTPPDYLPGFINVYSEIGKGTTIKVYFPEYADEASRQETGHAGEILKGQGQTILLVEDEKAIREMVLSVLERLGYHVLSAESPGRAIRLADTHREEIALLLNRFEPADAVHMPLHDMPAEAASRAHCKLQIHHITRPALG